VVNSRALLLFRQKHPKFDRFVVRQSTANAKVHLAEAGARRAQVHRAPSIADRGVDIFLLIRSAVPTTLPAQIRDDVIGAMALEVVEGKLRPTDIRRRVREYVTAQFRQFSKYGPASLDARLSEDGNATLLDRLALFGKLLPLFGDLEPVRFIRRSAGLQRALPTIIRILTITLSRTHHFCLQSSTRRRMGMG
jgi:hypothetical protein